MKVLVVLCALMAAVSASPLFGWNAVPLTYSAVPVLRPEITTYSVKAVEKEVDALHDGYVAITPGAKHVAELPFGMVSHHVNLKKAPGTK